MNIYELITKKITDQLEQGIIPWQKPWVWTDDITECAISYKTQKPYSLLNQMLLCGRTGEYLTFNQVKDLGGKVRKGAKSGYVVFFQPTIKQINKEDEDTGEEIIIEKKSFILRGYSVFHIDDCEGIKSKLPKKKKAKRVKLIDVAEKIIKAYIKREKSLKFTSKKSDRAYFSPSTDSVVVPLIAQFKEKAEYYSTTFHELIHSTLMPNRCNRNSESATARFGSHEYSKEELVAEMGAAMLLAKAGIDTEGTLKNSVAYIQSWLRALKNDKKMLVYASTNAQKAANYILDIKPQYNEK